MTWELDGAWDRTPKATVSVYLHKVNADADGPKHVAKVAEAIPYDSKSAVVDLSEYSGELLRLIIRKDGDSETGGQSETFDIE